MYKRQGETEAADKDGDKKKIIEKKLLFVSIVFAFIIMIVAYFVYKFLLNFSQESDMDVWTLVSACLYKLEKFVDKKVKITFQNQIINLVNPKFSQLGWEGKNTENSRDKELRGVLIRLLGYIGDEKEVNDLIRLCENGQHSSNVDQIKRKKASVQCKRCIDLFKVHH